MSEVGYREKCIRAKGDICIRCDGAKSTTDLVKTQVHHIDGDPSNNDLSNLAPLCKKCHILWHRSKDAPDDFEEFCESFPSERIDGWRDSGQYGTLLTDQERKIIASEKGNEDEYRYQAISRARNKIQDELTQDIEVLREHHPQLFSELQEVVCDVE